MQKRQWIDPSNPAQCQIEAVDNFYAGKPNARWELLVLWAALQTEGVELEPDFERVATVLLITAIVHDEGKLPRRVGKPEQLPVQRDSPNRELTPPPGGWEASVGVLRSLKRQQHKNDRETGRSRATPLDVATAFEVLMGTTPEPRREEVIAELAKRFHLDTRTVEKWIKRAGEDWKSSPDHTVAFLQRHFPKLPKKDIEASSLMSASSVTLTISRKAAATAARKAAERAARNAAQ